MLSPPDSFLLPEVVTVPKSIKIISYDENDLPSRKGLTEVLESTKKVFIFIYSLKCGLFGFYMSKCVSPHVLPTATCVAIGSSSRPEGREMLNRMLNGS